MRRPRVVAGRRTLVRTMRSSLRHGAFGALLLAALTGCTGDSAEGTTDAASASPLTTVALAAPPAPPAPADFAGAESCQSCHAAEYATWKRSTHGTAGGVPGSATNDVRVIAPFNGVPIRFRDAVVIPRQVAGRFSFLVQRPGEPDTTFSVDGVIGGGHMNGGGTQGFVTVWPDGTRRFLPFDWSRSNRVWFCHTGTRTERGWQPITPAMRLADCGDWPPSRILGDDARFSNCQSCHGSGITVGFDSVAKRWRTDVRSLAIDCESCHGPAAKHVRLMRAGPAGADIGLPALGALDKDRSLATCMGCHALKTRLAPGYAPGGSLEAYYTTYLSQLGDTPFTPDGRTRTFAYQEGHYASDCYRNGGMTCASCHDPHSQGYRTVDGEPIPGRFDDRQCTSCHASKAKDTPAHTKHPVGSTGSQCVSCHMPYEQQHELGRAIQYRRSDHSIAIPRPALDASLGLVGACQGCHATRSTAALEAQVTRWWGTLKPHETAVAGVLAARSVTSLEAATPLLLHPDSRNAMAQVAGLSEWLERFTGTSRNGAAAPAVGAPAADATARLRALADAPDLDVQALALAALHLARGNDPMVRRLLRERARPTDGDDRSALRRRWAVTLGSLGDAARTAGDAPRAIAAYLAALDVAPRDPLLLLNLGLARAAQGDMTGAVAAYRESLQRDPRQIMTEVNLGNALEQAGDPAGAVAAYERAIARDPTAALPRLNLGTHYLRNDQAAQARPYLEQALARDPGLATGHFQLALALLKAGDLDAAARAVRRSLALDTAHAEARKLDEALREARGGR
jgi:tetratricopeptide (TPR) repeat protein